MTKSSSAPAVAQAGSSANGSCSSSSSSSPEAEDPDPDEPPPKASFRDRMRFLSRRYGWWALAVYLLASAVDFSLAFLAIHALGADHIRDLEARVRQWLGMGKRELEDVEVAAWPIPVKEQHEPSHAALPKSAQGENNADEAKLALSYLQRGRQDASANLDATAASPKTARGGGRSGGGSGTIWTEAVLAYTIHKTLLLPFRVALTAAVLPSFVKLMVRLGWARPNAVVQQVAAKKAREKAAAKAAKAASSSTSAKSVVGLGALWTAAGTAGDQGEAGSSGEPAVAQRDAA